jgi:hypothetical protein
LLSGGDAVQVRLGAEGRERLYEDAIRHRRRPQDHAAVLLEQALGVEPEAPGTLAPIRAAVRLLEDALRQRGEFPEDSDQAEKRYRDGSLPGALTAADPSLDTAQALPTRERDHARTS